MCAVQSIDSKFAIATTKGFIIVNYDTEYKAIIGGDSYYQS